MILGIIMFIVAVMLCMFIAYVWKGASKETKRGLIKHLRAVFTITIILLVILSFIVLLF